MACYTCFSLKKVVLLLIKCTTFVNTLRLPYRGANRKPTQSQLISAPASLKMSPSRDDQSLLTRVDIISCFDMILISIIIQ